MFEQHLLGLLEAYSQTFQPVDFKSQAELSVQHAVPVHMQIGSVGSDVDALDIQTL